MANNLAPGGKKLNRSRIGNIISRYGNVAVSYFISGRYWNMVHGLAAEDVKQDLEGLQNMRILARNMAWHLKCQEAAKKAGVPMPKEEEITFTHFIR